MVEALKKLDRKFLMIAGFIILLPIILIVFLALIQSCGNRKTTYENYEQKMIKASEKYLSKKNKIPTLESELVTVKLDTLVDEKYIKSPKKELKDDSCTGEVKVRRNGSSIETNNGGFLNYTVSLNCDKYQTVTLADKIKENVVTSESGLYKVGDEYIFKGDRANNYIKFFDKKYRIVSIDNNNIIKLVSSEQDETYRIWDNKYNIETNMNSGKTIFKDSVIRESLLSIYKNKRRISNEAREHLIAYNICTGKRNKSDDTISRSVDCSERLDNQIISLLNVSDYALASYDPDCVTLKSKSCRNYNYLSSIASYGWTINPVSENTYEVFTFDGGVIGYKEASSSNRYTFVIYIDGDELYQNGMGSENNPYIIK